LKTLSMFLSVFVVLFGLAASIEAKQDEEKVLPTARQHAEQRKAICGDSTFFRQGNFIWELRGQVDILCCHEAPEELRNDANGITWRGTIEVSSHAARVYDPKLGWSKWGEDPPLLFSVYKQRGQWRAEGLDKISCADVPSMKASGPGGSRWLFPDSDSRYLTESDLAGLSPDELWTARNEIYARRGFIFKTEKGKQYARSLGSAYRPTTESPKFNRFEQKNIDFIQSFQKGRKR
jgi:hypothetical protein